MFEAFINLIFIRRVVLKKNKEAFYLLNKYICLFIHSFNTLFEQANTKVSAKAPLA